MAMSVGGGTGAKADINIISTGVAQLIYHPASNA